MKTRGEKQAAARFGIGLTALLAVGASVYFAPAAEAAQYVNGQKCTGEVIKLASGYYKCRTANGVAEGPAHSATKLPMNPPKRPPPKPAVAQPIQK